MNHAAILALLAALCGCKVATVRPLASASPQVAAFDARAYAESIWSARVVPTIEREAVECAALLGSLKTDPEGTRRRLGRGARGTAYFLAKGEGRAVSVDRRSRAGLLGLDVAPVDGEADLWIQIGPVLQGMALRDAVGFITFDQFKNQLDYADVGNALNQHVLDSVLAGLDADTAQGADFSFAGALVLGERLQLTPIRLSRKETRP